MSFVFQFTRQLRDVAGKFAKAEGETLALRAKELEFLAQRFVNLEKSEAPKKTGKFADKIGYRMNLKNGQLGFETFSPEPLATFIRKGTRKHPIMARRARYLSFYWESGPDGPGRYFFKRITHPGTKANDYTARALAKWRPYAHEKARKMALDIAKEMTT